MSNPQQQELRRAGRVPALNPDATETARSADQAIRESLAHGTVPREQQRGHQPDEVQDKPDLDAFADRLGVRTPSAEPKRRPAFLRWWQLWAAIAAGVATILAGIIRSLLRGRS